MWQQQPIVLLFNVNVYTCIGIVRAQPTTDIVKIGHTLILELGFCFAITEIYFDTKIYMKQNQTSSVKIKT